MRISTKGLYALRMLVDLAEHQNVGYVSLKDIADRQNISKKYLEQIVPTLGNSGIVVANRGSQGGYMLAKSPEKVTVGDILRLTEGSLCPVPCADSDPAVCEQCGECTTYSMWKELSKLISDYLDGISIQNLLDEKRDRDLGDYVI